METPWGFKSPRPQFPRAAGTLWPVTDRPAAILAADFYQHLAGTGSPDAERSARALHDAVRRLRGRYPATPTLWAAHIHTGA